MRKLLVILLFFLTASASADKVSDCSFRGKKLYGCVKVVSSYPDFRVKIVNSFPDLNVKKVDAFPDQCGLWKFVDSHEDFTVMFVDSHEDFSIKYVDSFPGMP